MTNTTLVRDFWRRSAAVFSTAMVTAFAGCESGSSGSDSDDDAAPAGSVVFSGRYTNGGAPLPSQQSGGLVTRLDVTQNGDSLTAKDNQGQSYSGNIGEANADGGFPFNLEGSTTDGQPVVIAGSFRADGNQATMAGTWYQVSIQASFNGHATLNQPLPAETPPTTGGETPPPATGTPPPAGGVDYVNAPASFSVGTCKFIDDAGVGGWPITTILRSVSVSGGKITMVYDDVSWPASGDPAVNGNCWLVLDRGGWQAKTFDWLRPNQETKDVAEAAHERGIKRVEKVGVLVSTLARDKRRNGDERSNIFWITWP
jgi:hypothetical protein